LTHEIVEALLKPLEHFGLTAVTFLVVLPRTQVIVVFTRTGTVVVVVVVAGDVDSADPVIGVVHP
jgi:hypothetical protein